MKEGKYREALGKWEAALMLTPDKAVLHEQKAQVLLELGDAWSALKAANREFPLLIYLPQFRVLVCSIFVHETMHDFSCYICSFAAIYVPFLTIYRVYRFPRIFLGRICQMIVSIYYVRNFFPQN